MVLSLRFAYRAQRGRGNPTLPNQPSSHAPAPMPGRKTEFHTELDALNQRLYREGVLAVELLEGAVDAFKRCDREAAARVRKRDSEVDREEIRVEEETVRLIALHQPVAKDLRRLMVILKANADVERVADHASGVCKSVLYLSEPHPPLWPPSLLEMADRVQPRAHETLRALQTFDLGAAEKLIQADATLDALARRTFEEIEQFEQSGRLTTRAALLAFRASRELERIADLFSNICEDIIYVQTGRIVRHAKSLGLAQQG